MTATYAPSARFSQLSFYAPEHILRDLSTVAIWPNPDRQSAPLSFVMVAYKQYDKESHTK